MSRPPKSAHGSISRTGIGTGRTSGAKVMSDMVLLPRDPASRYCKLWDTDQGLTSGDNFAGHSGATALDFHQLPDP
jgi:hypothetical protein